MSLGSHFTSRRNCHLAHAIPSQINMWSHSLRGQIFADDSDDSDVENASAASPSDVQSTHNIPMSDDSQFLKDLDLSSRQDNAQYKPNPWAIAKINAASRKAQSQTHQDATASVQPMLSKSKTLECPIASPIRTRPTPVLTSRNNLTEAAGSVPCFRDKFTRLPTTQLSSEHPSSCSATAAQIHSMTQLPVNSDCTASVPRSGPIRQGIPKPSPGRSSQLLLKTFRNRVVSLIDDGIGTNCATCYSGLQKHRI